MVIVDPGGHARRQLILELAEDALRSGLDGQRRLLPAAVEHHLDGRLPVEAGMQPRLLKAILDASDIPQCDGRPALPRNDRNAAELFRPLLALLQAQPNLPGAGSNRAGGDIARRCLQLPCNLIEREAIRPEPPLRDRHVGDVVGNIVQLGLGDGRIAKQPVAHPLTELPQRPGIHVAIERDLQDLRLRGLEMHVWLLGIIRKGADGADGLVDILVGTHLIRPGD